MFEEHYTMGLSHQGRIEVITGSMFSGKTEELLRRLRRALIAKQSVKVFKPIVDTRYASESVVSHDANRLACLQVDTAARILENAEGVDVVGIDEAQFFGPELPDVCRRLADAGHRVVVAGLDMDFLGKPFGPMPQLMAVAEMVTKVHAVCEECGHAAQFSFRVDQARDNLVLLGEKDLYKALCRTCFCKAMAKNNK